MEEKFIGKRMSTPKMKKKETEKIIGRWEDGLWCKFSSEALLIGRLHGHWLLDHQTPTDSYSHTRSNYLSLSPRLCIHQPKERGHFEIGDRITKHGLES